jgi:alanyl-tRNA synthetase
LQALTSRVEAGASGSGKFLVEELPGLEGKALQEAATSLLEQLGDQAAVVLASKGEDEAAGKVNFVAAVGPAAVKAGLQAGKLVNAIAKVCGGGGGGKAALAQAGAKDASKLPEALKQARTMLSGAL